MLRFGGATGHYTSQAFYQRLASLCAAACLHASLGVYCVTTVGKYLRNDFEGKSKNRDLADRRQAATTVQGIADTKVINGAKKISDERLELVVHFCHAFLVDWLSIVASSGAFQDRLLSLSTRQLLDHERDAIGHFLRQMSAATQPHGQALSYEELLRNLTIFRKSHNSQQQHSAGAMPGPLTHCNQLQLLSAARLTDCLDFSDCSLRGCRLAKGHTHHSLQRS